MINADSLKRLIEDAYWPVYKLAALIPAPQILFTVAGLGACIAAILGLNGGARWAALLLALYLFGGAWLLSHTPLGVLGW